MSENEQNREQRHGTVFTCTETAKILGMCISGVRQAARRGELEGVYGGLMNDRLVGVTSRSVEAVIDRRREIAGKRPAFALPLDGYDTRDLHPAVRQAAN